MIKSLLYFVAAGLCEIGGGYLVWLWLRENRPFYYAVIGAAVLVLYGVIPTLQPADFGLVYADCGGVYGVLSILWGWRLAKISSDRFDLIGGAVPLVGVFITISWPR